MNRLSRVGLWMGGAFCAALAAAVIVLVLNGTGLDGTGSALRLTARISFLFFWAAYVGSAMAVLFGSRFDIVARRSRELGLAFASAQLVHLGVVFWLAWISSPQSIRDAVMPFFAIGIMWTYLLAFSSLDSVQVVLSPNLLRALRTIGLEYIALTFFVDFVILPTHPLQHPLQYGPFWIMLVAGPFLRLAATLRQAGTPRSVPAAQ